MRRFIVAKVMVAVGFAAALVIGVAAPASASAQQHITITTSKAPGPVPGSYTASGAFVDSGSISNLSFRPSAVPAPTFLVSHITVLFTGAHGTFTLKAQITETLTSDPNVLADEGTWTIIEGTGAYARLHGQGEITGVVDDNVNVITRVFDGDVHFD